MIAKGSLERFSPGWGLILKEFLPSILTCPRRSSMVTERLKLKRTSEFQSAPPPPPH
jgi:hypothetical protein